MARKDNGYIKKKNRTGYMPWSLMEYMLLNFLFWIKIMCHSNSSKLTLLREERDFSLVQNFSEFVKLH